MSQKVEIMQVYIIFSNGHLLFLLMGDEVYDLTWVI